MIDHWLHIIVPALTEIFLIVMICFIMLIDVFLAGNNFPSISHYFYTTRFFFPLFSPRSWNISPIGANSFWNSGKQTMWIKWTLESPWRTRRSDPKGFQCQDYRCSTMFRGTIVSQDGFVPPQTLSNYIDDFGPWTLIGNVGTVRNQNLIYQCRTI